jgi:GMP synthase (glutamine-hydrolysing)
MDATTREARLDAFRRTAKLGFPYSRGFMKQLLLLKVGHTFEHIAAQRGDYDDWFRERLGTADGALTVTHVDRGEALPESFDYAGIVVTGSFAMVTDREAWSVAVAAYLREAVQRAVPTLGVCYGHQLLADAFGGEVADNPRGRQAGTVTVQLSPEAALDPLFSGMPETMRVHVSHRQSVISLPPQATLLATCAGDPHQAFRIGELAWGVQFHPEFDAWVARSYIEARREIFLTEGRDPDALIAAVEDSDHGARVLSRFARLVS